MASTTVRFSQFNASLNRNTEGQLLTDLSTPNNAQAKTVAEIIQRNNPDVLLINEFDYSPTAVNLFRQNYLQISQNGVVPVNYPYFYIAPSNTGIASGFDLNNNGTTVTTQGTTGYGDDAFGFGNFPGQFGMLLLSKYPIDTTNIRTFQNFLWKDMPGNLLTNDPTLDNSTTAIDENLNGFYSPEEINVLRLSSKSHWDVPIQVNGETVHVLVSHPTPPTFDGTEDRNGKRNSDEIRFWADYITPGKGDYIYDDGGKTGNLPSGSSFVIMGDQNADPLDGDSYNNAIHQLLLNPSINTNVIPTSLGAPQQATSQGGANTSQKGNPAFDTADFNDTAPGNLRTDYVLPSTDLQISNSGVYWPSNTDANFPLVGTFNASLPGGFPSSDHRLVFADVQVGATEAGKTVVSAEFTGQKIFNTGFIPTGAAQSINGVDVPVGGLSGVTYDAANNQYYAIADDRSSNARFYTFTLDPVTNAVTFTKVVQLKDSNGNPFAANSLDPEGIALTKNGTVFISSEGEVSANRVIDPFIKEFNLTTGQEIKSLAVPTKFKPIFNDLNSNGVLNPGEQTLGIRNNLAFESLTISPDQKTLFTATESGLFQDGGIATTTTGARSRIIQYNLVTGQPEKEYLYVTDPIAIAPNPITGFADNGLVDLLAIDNRGTLLALERSFAVGQGNTIKIYEISLQGATDINTIDSLSGLSSEQLAAIQPTQKRLILNLDSLNLPNSDGNHPTGTDNIEGLAFGPKLADGSQSIVLVSDNNFGATQFTQIINLSADVVPTVTPIVETRPALLDDDSLPFSQRADADDPAIYVNSTDSSKSLVFTSVKNGGLRIYDLAGNLLQTINPSNPDIRYNNVDLQYGFTLGGQKIDIAIASDRNNDKLAIFKINPNSTNGNFLENITDSNAATIFQGLPFATPYSESTRSAYGLAIYRSPVTNDYYVFTSRRQTGDVAQLKLVDKGNGTIGYELVRNFTIPAPTTPDASAQTEGMVVDQETGFLYIGQEDVGIWKFKAEPNGGTTGTLIEKVKAEGGKNLINDVEGLTIYYGKNGTGYLLASSQGDNTFAVYTRESNNEFLGRFGVGNNGGIDSVQESDGADVINLPLGPNFPYGVFITQDGSNDPATIVDDENISSNFKLVPWENIANAFPTPLNIDTTSYNPRTPQPNFVDLELSQTANVTNPVVGQQVTFTLTLSNKGSLLANGIKVTDLLPQQLTFISATPQQGTYNSQTGVWNVGEIAGNTTRTLTINAKIAQSGAVINKAEITGQNQSDFDSVAGNNNAQEDDQVSTTLNIASNMVTLKGFASLPADTFAAGPASGSALTNPTNGRPTPFNGQPVQGFSGVQFAPDGGGSVFWFLADNGFGAKNNSADFLLRLYQVDPNFAGTENGNGSVAVQSFIQLSDPNKLIPFDIVNKNTANRELTGADFDVESFVIDAKGDIWVGDEFGTYLLHFNSNGVLLDAPFATPNPVQLNTLNGQDPIVIGHRGASGELPEHTIEAYRLAILRGADFIEPDLVSTSDGILIARHEPNLINTTDVASRPEFASRKTTKIVDGVAEEGFFASDFTLAEIKTLRAIMPQGFRDQVYNGLLEIPTLSEIIDLLKEVEAQTGKKIGIYPETKHPTFHDNLGLSLEEKLLTVLNEKGFTDPTRVFIQSFEVSNLKELNTLTNLPLVQLLDAYDVANDGTLIYQDVNARPYDFTVAGDTRTYGDLQTPAGLAEIAAYADGIGPWKRMIVSVKTVDNNNDGQPDDLNNDGVINDADKVTLAPTSLVSDAHKEGLVVHPYTFRNENRYLASNYNNNPELEYRQFINLGVDGYFTDFPGTGDLVRDQITGDEVRSPQNPTVLSTPKFDTLTGQAPIVIGHRGASGDRPEHTIEAYKLAIAQGADFIEPDLVVTKDGILIARHEPLLAVAVLNTDGTIQRDANGKPVINTTDTSTDVYLRDKFADRLTIKNLDGRNVAGWYAEDFTLAEVKELNAIERIPALRGTAFNNDGLKVPTLAEVIDLVKQVEQETGRKIGIYPETKHPTFFQQQGINTSQLLVDTLKAENFTDPSRIFIQSFEVANLKALNNTIMPTAGIDIPLVQLFGGSGQPYDFVVAGDTRTYTNLSTPAGLAEIATYAQGIGPNKQRIIPQLTVDANNDGQADDLNGDGQISDGDRVLGTPTTLIQDAHTAGLIVHLYTLRNDEFFLPDTYKNDPGAEFRRFIDLGVDGFFTDFPKTGRQVLVNDYLAGTGYANPNANLNSPYFSTSPNYFDPNQPYYGDLVTANLNRSQGFEGMAFSPDRQTLYPLLEGTVVGDPIGSLRIYKFDVASESYQGLVGRYQLTNPSNAIGDFTPINNNEFLIIERDNGQGSTAAFKKIFKVDFSKIDANGFVSKEEIANLLNIQDPNDLNGDGKTTYDMPFQTIEDVLVLDSKTILVANDNNYPFSIGRPPAIDNNEIVVLELDQPLNLDSRLGVSAAIAETAQVVAGTTGIDDLFVNGGIDGINDIVFTGASNDTIDTVFGANSPFAGNNNIDAGSGNDSIFVNKGDRAFGSDGNDTFDARDGKGGNRMSGGAGDDTFFLGSNDRALGGDGNDKFYVVLGDGNLLSGGAGADQFWIVNGELPKAANTILDFQIGTDVLGISGQGAGFDFSDLTLNGNSIAIGTTTVATLSGVSTSSLTAANFAFV
ncbi:phytase [Anabaena sp. UHCC 0253]|uniref:phytase n=1 Tax=Anabaena sp. UHCC 0253 TaxID=2590019 RepID=UPI001446A3F4|nr:phytase [Anabaena sp. UHCC 0253]MTJ51999.1 phytase [Anabaena sp. UHCC 0253]